MRIPDGWTHCRLGQLIEVRHGWPFRSDCFSEELTGLPIVVAIGNFRYSGGFRFGETTLKEYRGTYPREYELTPGDTLLVMTCQTPGGEILGLPARVPDDTRLYLHNQRLGKVVIRDDAVVDPDFLYWVFLWRDFNRELAASATGTKIVHTAPSRIEAFEFSLPPLIEQRAIAHVLGALDAKIESNRRMNDTLDAMARALFKSWFVDFDPVRAKAEGRDPGLPKHIADLFPDRLVESELGEIPEGWTVCQLSDVTEYLSRGISPAYVETGGILVLNQKCVRDGQVDWVKGRRHDEQKKGTVSRRLKVGDVLVNSTGVGTLGRVAQVLWLPEDAVVDSHVTVVRAKTLEVSPAYLGMELRRRESEIEALGEGSTGQTELSRTRLSALMLIAPTASVLDCFSRTVAPLWSRVALAWRQSEVLSQIRDALLPKLVSGELRIGETGRVVEDAVA